MKTKTSAITLAKSILAASLVLVSLATQAQIKLTLDLPGRLTPDVPRSDVKISFYQEDRYQDLRVRCESAAGNLEFARAEAARIAKRNIAQAVTLLKNSLEREARWANEGSVNMMNPNMIIALRQANRIANKVIVAGNQFKEAYEPGQLEIFKLTMLDHLTSLVLKAHRDLDLQYFYSMVGSCHHRDCNRGSGFDSRIVPEAYLTSLSELSMRFIETYLKTKDFMRFDAIELQVASQVAASAATILASNGYARNPGFACAVTRLANLNQWIVDEMSRDPSYENLISVTGETRDQMIAARNQIFSAQCHDMRREHEERPREGGRHHHEEYGEQRSELQ